MPLFQEIIFFLKNPKNYKQLPTLSISQKIWWLFGIWSAGLTISIGLSFFVISPVLEYFKINSGDHLITQEFQTTPIWIMFILACIIAPLTEELAFRYFLKPKFRFVLALSLAFLIYFVTSFGLTLFTNIYNLSLDEVLLGQFLLAIIPFFTLVFSIIFFVLKPDLISNFFDKYLLIFIPISSLVFALMHIANFENFQKFWFLTPILVLPQLVVGIALVFIRFRFDFLWAMVLHFVHNFSIFLLPMLLYSLPKGSLEKIVSLNSEDYFRLLTFKEIAILSSVSLYTLFLFSTSLGLFIFHLIKFIQYKKLKTTELEIKD